MSVPAPDDVNAPLRASESSRTEAAASKPSHDQHLTPPSSPAALNDEFSQLPALRPVATTATAQDLTEEEEAQYSTPVAPETRIEPPVSCPPAPKKPRLGPKRRDHHSIRSLPLLVSVSAEEMDGMYQGLDRRRRMPVEETIRCLEVAAGSKRKRESGGGDKEE